MLPVSNHDDIDLYSLRIIRGYIYEIQKRNTFSANITPNITELIISFYNRYFTNMENMKSTPLSLLCAVYNAPLLLHSTAVQSLNIVHQIQFLKGTKTVEELFQHQNKYLYEPMQHLVNEYHHKAHTLLDVKSVTQWTDCDMIISYIYYLTNTSNKLPFVVHIEPDIWKFISHFRNYCHDMNYSGMDLLGDYQTKVTTNNLVSYVTHNICSKYSLHHHRFAKAGETFIQWLKHTMDTDRIDELCSSQKANKMKSTATKMQIGTSCSVITDEKDMLIVSGFIRENMSNCNIIHASENALLYSECLVFYQSYFVDLGEKAPSPFTVLFGIFNLDILLKIDGWQYLNVVEQSQYLQPHKIDNYCQYVVNYLMQTKYDFNAIECENGKIFHDLKYVLEMYYKHSEILNRKAIKDWNSHDIILSFTSFCIQSITEENALLWSFVDRFRKYVHLTKYDGDMLLEFITENHRNHAMCAKLLSDVYWINKQTIEPFIIWDKVKIVLNKWSVKLYKQFKGMIAVISEEEVAMNAVTTTGQQFIYKIDCNPVLSNHLLIAGYTRYKCHETHIPLDVQHVIEQFYGKTYMIHGDEPNENEFDYAVEFLVPMKRIGINLNKAETKITNCSSSFAQKNIIPNSDIIQVNQTYVKGRNLSVEKNDDLWSNLKQNGNSFVVFRAQKEFNAIGTHFMFDIKMKRNSEDEAQKFPFDKFDAIATVDVFKRLWNNHDLDILDLYANKQCLSGGSGVSLLLFVDGNVSFSRYKDLRINSLIQRVMGRKFTVELSYTMKGLKGYGINTPWSTILQSYWETHTKPLRDLIYLVRGVDDGRDAWYYVLVEMDKLQEFLQALKDDIIHLEEYGVILYSAYGADAPQEITDKLKKIWKIRD